MNGAIDCSQPSNRGSVVLGVVLLLGVISVRDTLAWAQQVSSRETRPSRAAERDASERVGVSSSVLPPLIVVGFAGGFIKRTSRVHGEVELASRLREKYGAAIHADIFENHHGDDAYRHIVELLAAAPALQPQARIILYGHSWGASEAVDVARRLGRDGVKVQLLIEVDGVRKHEHDDAVVPSNVAQAINFYQTEGVLHGRPLLHALDPATTQVIDNIQLSYKDNPVPTPGYPWFARTFTRAHIEIENDPRVWRRVEALIQANLPDVVTVSGQPRSTVLP